MIPPVKELNLPKRANGSIALVLDGCFTSSSRIDTCLVLGSSEC